MPISLFIDQVGSKFWYCGSKRNRLNGPAIQYVLYSGIENVYYIDDVVHRLDGPASYSYSDNFSYEAWYYEGRYIDCSTQGEFERLIKLKFLW